MILDGNSLTLESFNEIVDKSTKLELSPDTLSILKKSREVVERHLHSEKPIYSINTGFGYLSKIKVPHEKLTELQYNIIRSHCAGVGESHSEKESRAILLLRANVLAKGYSGVRPELVQFLVDMLNAGIHPVIPQKGSVGASGDLAPLAHLASVVIGEGEAFYKGEKMPGHKALELCGLEPFVLAAKEGLSLINGTQQMTAMGALILRKAEELAQLSDLISSASLEGLMGSAQPLQAWIHETRPFEGQIKSAANLNAYMKESEILKSHTDCDRVQDPYSFRCTPQVHGASRELLSFIARTLTTELNAATDNPLVNWKTGEILSNGNFHGQPIAFALDILCMAMSELASISERRMAKLTDPEFSGLPALLIKNEGLNSGFMAAHYTAASLVAENKIFCHPGSVDSIPTCVDKEDHVSMGPNCARKASMILKNTQYVLAIEALSACQALDFRKPKKPGRGPLALHHVVRSHIPFMEQDRYLHPDIELLFEMISSGKLASALKDTLL